jgi:hypothetical protein
MPNPSDPASFRAEATAVFHYIVIGAIVFAACCAAFGWWRGGPWGLVIGALIGIAVGGCAVFAGSLIWAMTQDGA